jgi:putative ABC transport system permease protein
MLINYFKVALRYLTKYKGYSFINVLGLTVGIASCILIMLFVKSEWSFDRFHSKSDRIHRAWLRELYEGQVIDNTVTPVPLGPLLQRSIPELQSTCRVYSFSSLIKVNNIEFNEQVNMVDSSFFNLFDFKLTQRNVNAAFATNNSIIINRTAAKKYFGNSQAIGKILELQVGTDKVDFTISAIADDVPMESSIQFSMLIPFSNASLFFSEAAQTKAWSSVSVETYLLLKEGVDMASVNRKIPSILDPVVAKNYKPGEYTVTLQPITDIHLNNSLPEGNVAISDPKYSYILATIGLMILLIGCINFVTLSIGRSTTRALEVGVRKVLGAERQQLIRQFWGEAMLLTLISLICGIVLAISLLRPFNELANRALTFSFEGFTVLFCFLLVVVIGFIAGIYPAFVLSGFKPIEVLKGRLMSGINLGLFRKALVMGQFIASIIMIICTITIAKQLQFLRTKDLGYNKEQVVIISTNKPRVEGNQIAERFKTAIAENPQIISSSHSMYSMAETGWMTLGYLDNRNAFRQFRFNAVDADFIRTLGLKLVAGRNFMKGNIADSNHIIVNEALVKEYGWKDPIGQTMPGKYTQQIIGVVKDFHFESLHTNIKPVVLALKLDSIRRASSDLSTAFSLSPRISVRLRAGDHQKNIEFLKASWKSVAGNQDFDFRFLDDVLNAAYSQEQRLGNIVRYASFLSIFIACMGLFGLATLVVVKRKKEIGIRKVLGADIPSIIRLLCSDFVLLVMVAALIAFPLSWWALSSWLKDFTYRINIPIWSFLVAAVLALLIAVLTVSIHAIRAAIANPVKSLRTE